MIKSGYLGQSISQLSKLVIYEFQYGHVKPEFREKAKLYSMDTDSFIVYIKTEDIYLDIAKDVEVRFDTSNYKLDRIFPNGKIKK